MKNNILIIGLILIIAISGCTQTGSQCPSCPGPDSYSECNDQAVKTRTNYRCSEATNYECESYTQETQCATEIKLTKRVGDISGTIKPSIDNKVKGIINIEINRVPDGTQAVGYYLEGGDLPPIGDGRAASFAENQGDVWTGMIDTTEYGNGLYDFASVVWDPEDPDGNPMALATAQILISN